MKTRGDDREGARQSARESSRQFISEIKVKASTDLNDSARASLAKERGSQTVINRERHRDEDNEKGK